jgi:aminopeptidase N
MEKSNFGGMENVGNTTILTSAALIDEFTTDRRLEYAHGVILHEFEHNQCGSDVTMETPFDMWLNEAFTVDVERQFMTSQFDPDCMRLDQVDAMRAPIGGPLAIEDAGHMGNIVREGFNDPDEVVDGVTYVKAAEVIRMLRLVIGDDAFRRAKNVYFERHDGGNANTAQFLGCFEEISGRDLDQFEREWLYTIGYPRIEATYRYDAVDRVLHVTLTQGRVGEGGLFHVPVALAAVDEKGCDIPGTQTVAEVTGERLDLAFANIPRPAFVSFNRDCSFYGTFGDGSAEADMLIRQVRLDPNTFNRVEAMRRLTDMERIRLIEDDAATVSEAWLDTYGAIVRDRSLAHGVKAYLLRIDEQSLDRRYLARYRERYGARERLLCAAATAHEGPLLEAWHAAKPAAPSGDPRDGIDDRRLKSVLLRTLVALRTADVFALAASQFRNERHISDRLSALTCIHVAGHPRRDELLREAFEAWKDHIAGYTAYLQVIGFGTDPDVFDLIRRESERPCFQITHPGHSRALFLPMGSNNKMLWTDEGIRWAGETVLRMAGINENTANRLLASFQLVRELGDDLRPGVIAALRKIKSGLDPARSPSVAGRVAAYLAGA